MKPHLKYLQYIARHKWFVLLAGLKTGAPLWALIIHDWSKFSRAEWGPYVRSFYGGERTPSVRAAFKAAWLHHQQKNPHHWQNWILSSCDAWCGGCDDCPKQPRIMPEKFVREMVADWMGAGRAITGKWEVHEWYAKERDKMMLHPNTQERVEALLEEVR